MLKNVLFLLQDVNSSKKKGSAFLVGGGPVPTAAATQQCFMVWNVRSLVYASLPIHTYEEIAYLLSHEDGRSPLKSSARQKEF